MTVQLSRAVKWLEAADFETKIIIAGEYSYPGQTQLRGVELIQGMTRKPRYNSRQRVLRRVWASLSQPGATVARGLPRSPLPSHVTHLLAARKQDHQADIPDWPANELHRLWLPVLAAERTLGLRLRHAQDRASRGSRSTQSLGRHPARRRHGDHPHTTARPLRWGQRAAALGLRGSQTGAMARAASAGRLRARP